MRAEPARLPDGRDPVVARTCTRWLVTRHLAFVNAGLADEDAEAHYAPDVAVLTRDGVRRGWPAAREQARALHGALGGASLRPHTIDVRGSRATVVWAAGSPDDPIVRGRDVFVLSGDRIVLHATDWKHAPLG